MGQGAAGAAVVSLCSTQPFQKTPMDPPQGTAKSPSHTSGEPSGRERESKRVRNNRRNIKV